MVSRDHEVCLAAEYAERRRSPSTTEFGDAAAQGANPESNNPETRIFLGDDRTSRSVLNLIWHTTPRSDVNWLEACSLRPMNIFDN